MKIIGRTEHVAAAEAAFTAITGGGVRAIFFTGDRGLGKTETVDFVAGRLDAAGATVLRGRCLDIGEVSWCPLLVALKRLRTDTVADLVAVLENGEATADSAGPLFHRVSEGLEKICADRPLVLIVDDLQFVDNATLRFLQYLLAGLGPDRVLLVAALRLRELRPEHRVARLLADLRRQPSVAVHDLKPFTRAQTDELVARIVGEPSEAAPAELLWRRSRGNPFLVEALARAERDGIRGVPEELRDIALAQIAALPDDARAVVRAVVVGRRPVSYPLLREVTDLSDKRAAAAVAAARRSRVLDEGPDGYCVHVGLFAEVIEASLEQPDRIRLNVRFAEALPDSEQGQLARHWLAAERPNEAQRCAVRAAERALDLHRYGEAHAYWAMAAATAGPADDRHRLWRNAAEAAHHSGDHVAALRILDRLASTLARPLPSWWHLMRARFLARSERPLDALAEYHHARRAARDCPPEEWAKANAHLADLLVQLGRYKAAQQAATRALKVIRGDAKTRTLAASALGISQAYLDHPETGLTTLLGALAAAEKDGAPTDVILVRHRLAELLTGPLNELDRGIEIARVGAELAERSGLSRTHGARLYAVVAAGLFRAGRWAEADEAIDAAMEHTPSGAAAVELLIGRAKVALGHGELDRGERDLAAVEALTAGGGSVRHVLPLFTLRAGLALWRGRPAEAAEAVDTGLHRWVRQTEDLEMRAVLVWHGLRAAAESGLRDSNGRVTTLRAAVRDIATASEGAAGPVKDAVNGYLVLCHAESSRITGRSTVDAWERAVEVWRERRHPYPEAYALLRLAQARYIAERMRDGERLREAHATATALGARPLVAEIEAFARRIRVELEPRRKVAAAKAQARGPVTAGPLANLTAREFEVLGFAADGLTNKQIGAKLFISRKTVALHLSNVFAKLQVDNRIQAGNIYRSGR